MFQVELHSERETVIVKAYSFKKCSSYFVALPSLLLINSIPLDFFLTDCKIPAKILLNLMMVIAWGGSSWWRERRRSKWKD